MFLLLGQKKYACLRIQSDSIYLALVPRLVEKWSNSWIITVVLKLCRCLATFTIFAARPFADLMANNWTTSMT